MANFKRKTFGNSYLFNLDQQNFNKINRKLADYIVKAKRIDKSSEAFNGIVEEVKRFQSTSILYSVLLNDKVVLCINDSGELPAAFKVYEANDIRFREGPKVFIDCTGLIKLVNGYLVCKKIDVFFTYLYEALNILLYMEEPMKYMSNSAVSMSGAECYVALFNYVIDYKRIIGYTQNKNKISYLIALFFLNNMMGKEIDTYAKNLAAKIAKLSNTDIRGFDLYYDEDRDFESLDSFISMLSETFKLKGFNTEVFVGQWMYSFGKGTEYATELYSSFANMMIATYCGAYIVHQKTIEKCCGASMVSFVTSITKLGSSVFDKRPYTERYNYVNPATRALQEKLNIRNKRPAETKFTETNLSSLAETKKFIKALEKWRRVSEKEDKLGDDFGTAMHIAFSRLIYDYIKGKKGYAKGVLPTLCKAYKKYEKRSNKGRNMKIDLEKMIVDYRAKIKKAQEKNDKEELKKLTFIQKELMDAKNAL